MKYPHSFNMLNNVVTLCNPEYLVGWSSNKVNNVSINKKKTFISFSSSIDVKINCKHYPKSCTCVINLDHKPSRRVQPIRRHTCMFLQNKYSINTKPFLWINYKVSKYNPISQNHYHYVSILKVICYANYCATYVNQ